MEQSGQQSVSGVLAAGKTRAVKNSHVFFGATAVSDRLDVAVLVIRPMVGDIFHANLHPDTGTHSAHKLAK
jgi:hypothetical protein